VVQNSKHKIKKHSRERPPPHNLTNWTYKEKYNAKDCQQGR
jgi:hypothetical protein